MLVVAANLFELPYRVRALGPLLVGERPVDQFVDVVPAGRACDVAPSDLTASLCTPMLYGADV